MQMGDCSASARTGFESESQAVAVGADRGNLGTMLCSRPSLSGLSIAGPFSLENARTNNACIFSPGFRRSILILTDRKGTTL